MSKKYWIYVMASLSGTLYVGVTGDLDKRVCEHKIDLIDGFTKKYQCHKLVYFEEYGDVDQAIEREKQLKNWHRKWKINLIKSINPDMKDLTI